MPEAVTRPCDRSRTTPDRHGRSGHGRVGTGRCLADPVAERQGPLAAALADHQHHVVREVHIAQAHAPDLRASAAGVEEQQDQGTVAASLEVPAGAGGQQQPPQLLGRHGGGLVGYPWWFHLGHRVAGDLTLVLQPGVEHPQSAVAVGGGGGLPAGEQTGEVGLDVVAVGGGQVDAAGVEEGVELLGGLQVCLDGAADLFSARRWRWNEVGRSTLEAAILPSAPRAWVLLKRRARPPRRWSESVTAAQSHFPWGCSSAGRAPALQTAEAMRCAARCSPRWLGSVRPTSRCS